MGYALKIPRVDFSEVAIEKVTFIDEVPCTGITLSANSLTFEQAEETQTLTATITPSNTTDTLRWSSSDENVATVLGGVVTIHGIGTATITATCGEITASATISQISLKAEGTLKRVDGRSLGTNTFTTPAALSIASAATGQTTIGREYTGEKTLAVLQGDLVDFEMVPVPYGATKVKVATQNNAQITLNYIWVGDSTQLVEYLDNDYPIHVKHPTFIKSDVGAEVEFGQCIGFRVNTENITADVLYIYFE